MKKIFREPLVHFALIGAALFVLYGSVNDGGLASTDNRIVVSAGRIDQLVGIFQKTWQRPPTAEELKGLIDNFVLEEVYYRQAVAMGIDRNDAVIRRRLRQKFEFLTDDMAAAISPTDKDLTAYIATNQQKFKKDTSYTFSQVYMNSGEADADKLITDTLERLRNGDTGPTGSGLLPAYFESTSARVVDGSFGSGFSQILDDLETGQWTGPVESGLGTHLILLQDRVPGFVPELADIRPIVEREWANEKRIGTRQTINETLLANYDVVVEWPAE
jgi:hypothetical protein